MAMVMASVSIGADRVAYPFRIRWKHLIRATIAYLQMVKARLGGSTGIRLKLSCSKDRPGRPLIRQLR